MMYPVGGCPADMLRYIFVTSRINCNLVIKQSVVGLQICGVLMIMCLQLKSSGMCLISYSEIYQ